MQVCVLEDDATLNAQVCNLLTGLGHITTAFTNGNDLIRALRTSTFDLFVLDWQVPGATGIEVLENLRNVKQLTTPVLFLTGRTDEQDSATVLNAGADDYCSKPVKQHEFTARVNAILRRSYPPAKLEAKRNYYDYVFDINTQQVAFDGQVATLSQLEFKLAIFLFENYERPMARKRLLLEVWHEEGDALSRTLDVHISWLRKKLDLSSNSKRLHLKAIHGFGYRLMAVE